MHANEAREQPRRRGQWLRPVDEWRHVPTTAMASCVGGSGLWARVDDVTGDDVTELCVVGLEAGASDFDVVSVAGVVVLGATDDAAPFTKQ